MRSSTEPVDPSAEPILDVDDIQAHVVPGFGQAHQRLVGMRLDGREADAAREVRALLRWLLPRVTPLRRGLEHRAARRDARSRGVTVETPDDDPATAVAVSPRLLATLGDTSIAQVDQAFAVGMTARSTLHDPPAASWQVGTPGSELDLLIVLASDDPAALARGVADLRAAATGLALVIVHDQPGDRLPGDVEHFGFRDGISQPALRGLIGTDPPTALVPRIPMPTMPDGRAYAGPGDVLVWPGQFVLGLPRQSSTSPLPRPPRPHLPDLAHNGSFLVYRKLAQDVAGFRADTARAAAELTGSDDPDVLRALLIGRWPDGTPLVRGAPTTSVGRELNHFCYDHDSPDIPDTSPPVNGAIADPHGFRCPLAAHIRKVNPRDQATDQGPPGATLTFAILRRGIPYGPLWQPDGVAVPTDNDERGLLFLCYQADLTQQFELLVTAWANQQDTPRFGVVNGMDLIIGRPTPHPAGTRRAPLATTAMSGTISTVLDYIQPKGGAYLFTPSLTALRTLAAEPT